jgi:protease-4
MKKVIIGFLAFIGALALIASFVALLIGLFLSVGEEGVEARVIVELDLEHGLVEYVPDEPFGQAMLSGAVSVRDVVDGLARAAEDDRVVGLVARLGNGPLGLAQIQEIRDAVFAFRESGKPAVAWAETFGEVGPGNGAYYLATAFDNIWLQPAGDVGLTGLMYESPFIAGALDKLDVSVQMDHRKEYKNAMNLYTQTKYTPSHREAMQALMDSQFEQITSGIAEARGFTTDEVRALFDHGSFLGQEAADHGLVDGMAYRDEVYKRLEDETGGDPDYLYLDVYLERAGRPNSRGKVIALVYAVGGVARGNSGYDPFSGSFVMGSDSVAAALGRAIDDRRVEAIVLRVDSPGGSYVASDSIWRQTVRAREAGKPLIISMGNLAASGGYFIAMAADGIVAQPGTITGSIGVLGGKLNTTGFWKKLGITFDEVHTSENSLLYNSSNDYSESEWALFQGWLDRVYDDFTTRVADGRGLSLEKVHEIARGRVWTGKDALEIGLVDALGGLTKAIAMAREAADIPEDAAIRVKRFPRKKTAFESFMDEGPSSSHDQVFESLKQVVIRMRPAVRAADSLGLLDDHDQVLRMTEVPALR